MRFDSAVDNHKTPAPPSTTAEPATGLHLVRLIGDVRWSAIVEELRLSNREADLIRCMIDDDRELAIAQRLGISAHTVHTYLERLYRKLGVRSRCQLILRLFTTYLALQGSASHVTSAPAVGVEYGGQ